MLLLYLTNTIKCDILHYIKQEERTSIMKLSEMTIRSDESAAFALRELYQSFGYLRYKISKFEEYDFYARNKSFLVSESVLTFTDTNGKLLALKPDVTLSIVKNTKDGNGIQKVYYNENVYRVSGRTHEFQEIMQTGLECIGEIDLYSVCEVLSLAQKSLSIISKNYILDISHMGFLSSLLDEATSDEDLKRGLLSFIREKNIHGIKQLCADSEINENISERIVKTASLYGRLADILPTLRSLCINSGMASAVDELESISEVLALNGDSGRLHVDFSIVNDMNYYNGIIFQGYIDGIESEVLSGGRYGNLLRKMGRKSDALGFAVYLDRLERFGGADNSFDVDTLILYDDSSDVKALTKAVNSLAADGISVVAQKSVPQGLKFRTALKLTERGLEPVETND